MNLYKRLLSVTLITSYLFTGCSVLKNNIVDMDGLRVAYVVKSGGLSDESVGQLGYDGVLRAKNEFDIKEESLEVDLSNPEVVEEDLKKIAERNDLIIMNGKDLGEMSVEVSALFREKKIVIIGVNEIETNIHDINFKDEEAGFLMGIIAGRTTKTNKIGLITYERNIDTERLLAGFISGVKTVNPEAAKNLSEKESVIFISENGKEDGASELEAYEAARTLSTAGADVILEKLAKQEIGVFKAAQESDIKVIGVGTDKYEYYPEYRDVILSSILKKVDSIVYDVVKETLKGEFKSGEKNSKLIDLKSGLLDYAPSTENTVSKEVLNEVKMYKKQIIDKVFEVPKTSIEAIEFHI